MRVSCRAQRKPADALSASRSSSVMPRSTSRISRALSIVARMVALFANRLYVLPIIAISTLRSIKDPAIKYTT